MKIPQAVRKHDSLYIFLAIALLLIFRVVIQAILYQSGFIALTADEFARTVLSANWSEHPYLSWSGVWMPFHMYLFGATLFIKGSLIWIPRVVVVLMGLASIVLMYLFVSKMFNSWQIGLISAALLAVNPAHIWLSSTPLTEIPHAMFILAFLWCFTLYLDKPRFITLFSSAFMLAGATGFRFESWLISLLFSCFLFVKGLMQYIQKGAQFRKILVLWTTALIPWLFPLVWVIGNYVDTGNPFYFMEAIKTYKLQWYGSNISYGKYLEILLTINPYVFCLGLVGVVVFFLKSKKSLTAIWYGCIAVIPLTVYIGLSGGQTEPPHNYIRYFALFTFLFYPAASYVLYLGIGFFFKPQSVRFVLSGLILSAIMVTQIAASFHFTNDPAAQGVAVGEKIKELRANQSEISSRPMLIEFSYWQYLGIRVGANDIHNLLYDRVPDNVTHNAPSLLVTDMKAFRACLANFNISYLIIKSADLRQVIENNLNLRSSAEVNGYGFYPVSQELTGDQAKNQKICPLSFTSGP